MSSQVGYLKKEYQEREYQREGLKSILDIRVDIKECKGGDRHFGSD